MGKKKSQKKKGIQPTVSPKVSITTKTNISTPKKETKGLFFQVLAVLGIIILTFIAYQPVLDNDFVDWDDNVYVVDNPLVRNEKVPVSQVFKQPVSLNYHPLTILSMRWNDNECKECIHGISAEPFIRWNLILHIFNVILVFVLTYRLSREKLFVAIFSAVAFALHPMHVESVAWVSERKDVLYVFFFLAGLLSYDKFLTQRYHNSKTDYKWLALALVAFVLSSLSKAMAVVFPLVMILMDFWRNNEKYAIKSLKLAFQPKKLIEYVPFFAVALFFGLMALSVQSGHDFGGLLDKRGQEVAVNKFDTFSILQRLHFASYGFCMYLYKFFVPTGMCTFYPYPNLEEYNNSPIYWGLFTISILVALAAFMSLKRTKTLLFGIGFYFFSVAFVLQFISVGVVIMADRYTYLPYVGFAFMLAMLTEQYLPRNIRLVTYIAAASMSIIWFVQTREQSDIWQNSETLWNRVISLYPDQEQPYSIRGNYFGKMASKAMAKGDKVSQNSFIDKAAADFQRAIQLNSNRADVYEGMGNIHGMRSENSKAIEMYNKAIQFNPSKASVYINRGIAKTMMGDSKSALEDMTKAVELDPKPKHVLYRGIARQTIGDNSGARLDYEAVLKLEPGNQQAIERLKTLK